MTRRGFSASSPLFRPTRSKILIIVHRVMTLCHTSAVKPVMVLILVLLCQCAKQEVQPSAQFTTRELPWADETNGDTKFDWLQNELTEASERYFAEQYEISLDAFDPGELLEHSTLTQIAIEQGAFSNQDLFRFGDELFEYHFRPEDGWGTDKLTDGPTIYRVHREEIGGPDSFSCVDCHSKGGVDGAGSITQNAFFLSDGRSLQAAQVRNAPHLLGLGAIEALAAEMTLELQELRKIGIQTATTSKIRQDILLQSKGVNFGELQIEPDGEISKSNVSGIQDDLVVRPFGWNGTFATIREVVEHSFRVHLGMPSSGLQEKIRDGVVDGIAYGSGPWFDIDNDGVSVEVEDGMLTSVAVYLALLEVPSIESPNDADLHRQFERGREVFEELECHHCHVPILVLNDPKLRFQPTQSIYSNSSPIEIDLVTEAELPTVSRNSGEDGFRVNLYSDLKVHDMGTELQESSTNDESCVSCFRTPPLWGLAQSSPYLHDGRALTVDDAIRLHDGSGRSSRDSYVQSSDQDRAALQVFLLSLSRQPSVEVR